MLIISMLQANYVGWCEFHLSAMWPSEEMNDVDPDIPQPSLL